MKFKQLALTAFTMTVLLLGAGSILLVFEEEYARAAQMIILAAILDGFDGTLARALRAESPFGERLDTYIDCISFGVAPAVLLYATLLRDHGVAGAAAALLIVASGVIRFSRGCSVPSKRYRHVFRGLPIPVNATWLGVFVLIMERDLLDLAGMEDVRTVVAVAFLAVSFAMLFLQISNVRYLKPPRRQLGIAMTATAAAMALTGYPTGAFCLCTAASLLVYVIAGLRRHRELVALEAEEAEEESVAH